MYSQYYQARVLSPKAWFISGCFRNEDHLAFVRALEGHKDIFEFFVSKEQEDQFLDLMNYLQRNGSLISYKKMPNRLMGKTS